VVLPPSLIGPVGWNQHDDQFSMIKLSAGFFEE
jgi:hypothetical protein